MAKTNYRSLFQTAENLFFSYTFRTKLAIDRIGPSSCCCGCHRDHSVTLLLLEKEKTIKSVGSGENTIPMQMGLSLS